MRFKYALVTSTGEISRRRNFSASCATSRLSRSADVAIGLCYARLRSPREASPLARCWPRPFNVFHSQVKENRIEQRLLVMIEVPARLLLQHPDNIDQLLRGRQVRGHSAALGVWDLAEMHQRLRR